MLDSTVGMVGDLQAIAGKAMPEIRSLDMPLLEDLVNQTAKPDRHWKGHHHRSLSLLISFLSKAYQSRNRLRAAVVIEPVSVHNLCKMEIPRTSRRLSAFSLEGLGDREPRDEVECTKAGISGQVRRKLQIVAKHRTGWLRRQVSNSQMPD